jgi:FMN phosphatase YigB (HAD superfamily)
MSLTVLLDLDNTLLLNDMARFLPAYLKKLSSYLSEWPAEIVIQELLAGTRRMVEKKSPVHTLEEEFDAVFYPGLGVEKVYLADRIDRFYREGFPTLQGITSPRLEARDLVDFLFEKGWPVVIATNPLFPATAIEQRLKWAGLPIDRYPFSLVTSYESFHFCKPNPAYLAEILALLGWPDQPAVLIGDGLEEEIIPAGKLGIPAYWVTSENNPLPAGHHPLSAKGTIGGVQTWLRSLEGQELGDLSLASPSSILALLSSTPAALETITRNVVRNEWCFRPAPQEWAVNEILCHLRDVDREVNLPRMKQIASRANPFLAGIVTDIWAEERKYIFEDGGAALASFTATRSALIDLLASLEAESWKLPAQHAIFGPTQILELAGFIVTHDRTHIRQACAVINKLLAMKR